MHSFYASQHSNTTTLSRDLIEQYYDVHTTHADEVEGIAYAAMERCNRVMLRENPRVSRAKLHRLPHEPQVKNRAVGRNADDTIVIQLKRQEVHYDNVTSLKDIWGKDRSIKWNSVRFRTLVNRDAGLII